MKKYAVIAIMSLSLILLACNSPTPYEHGYDTGYKKGYEEGQKDGYSDGYYDGYKDGYDDGHDDGYSEGYEEGRIDYDDTSDDITRSQITTSESVTYIGNKNTMKFHKSTCSSINDMNEANKIYESREYFIEHDYQPCMKCNP